MTRTVQYDSRGNMVLNLEPNTSGAASTGNGWRYVYDANDALVGTSDARGCGENLKYDGVGRLLYEDYSPCTGTQAPYTLPVIRTSSSGGSSGALVSGVETYYVYDDSASGTLLNGHLSQIEDRAANTTFTYSGRGLPATISRQLAMPGVAATAPLGSRYASWTFSTSLSYDALNRPTAQSTGADVPELLGADVLGTGTNASRSLVTMAYSARGLAASVQGSYGTLVTKSVVDPDGAPRATVFGDAAGTVAYNCYDAKRQLSEYTLLRGATVPTCAAGLPTGAGTAAVAQHVLLDDVFTRDPVGNARAIADGRNPAEWPAGALPVTRSFTYDDAYRVIQANYSYTGANQNDEFVPPTAPFTSAQTPASFSATPNRVRSQTFSFDWLGNTNHTQDDATLFFDRSLGAVYNGTATNGPNQLGGAGYPLLIQGGHATTRGTLSTAYDAAGNMTSMSVTRSASCSPGSCASEYQYTWDEVGQLASATRFDGASSSTPAVSAQYLYDASGARVLRASTQESGSVTYNAEIFPTLRLDGAQWLTTTSNYERTSATESAYLGVGGSALGHVVYVPASTSATSGTQHVLLQFTDSLGSTAATVDQSSGELVERSTYQAFGQIESDYHASDWAAFWEPYKFTGKESDVEVGLTYFGARYYLPALGRWISPDPVAIHGLGGDPNPYAYVHGRATHDTDPTGLDDPPDAGADASPPAVTTIALPAESDPVQAQSLMSCDGRCYPSTGGAFEATRQLVIVSTPYPDVNENGIPDGIDKFMATYKGPVLPNLPDDAPVASWAGEETLFSGINPMVETSHPQETISNVALWLGSFMAVDGAFTAAAAISGSAWGGGFATAALTTGLTAIGVVASPVVMAVGGAIVAGVGLSIMMMAVKAKGSERSGQSVSSPSRSAAMNRAQLPNRGGLARYVPPDNWNATEPLPRGPQNGYMDNKGNEWVRGPSRTLGQPFEWDVQLPDGSHLNVSLDGEITHGLNLNGKPTWP